MGGNKQMRTHCFLPPRSDFPPFLCYTQVVAESLKQLGLALAQMEPNLSVHQQTIVMASIVDYIIQLLCQRNTASQCQQMINQQPDIANQLFFGLLLPSVFLILLVYIVSDVAILAGPKDRVLLTIGHEIGHILTPTLNNPHSEEAKAFAFTRAWLNAIKENDIANLGSSILEGLPANNGLHDVSFKFVKEALSEGKEALAIYLALVNGMLGVNSYAIYA